MKILIVEDENTIAVRLERLVNDILGSEVDKIFIFHRLDDAEEFLDENIIDLMFLDLNLAGLDGFELLKKVVAGSFHTIVVSAYATRAVEAFEYGVLDFITKPFTKDRLTKALSRLVKPFRQKETKYLAIKKCGVIEFIELTDVSYFKGANIYSEVYLKNGTQLLHDKSLNRLEQMLPMCFSRIHKSYIVNEKHIRGMSHHGNNAELVLHSGQSIPISRSKISEFKTRFI